MNKYLLKKSFKRVSSVGLALATAVNVAAPVMQASAAASETKPVITSASNAKTNVVFIIMDDMGYSDFGCYGSEIKTPNIDKIAANGLVYNDFNVCPVCSPTRASLLTGRDNQAVGMGYITNLDMGPEYPNYRGRITDQSATLAQILQTNGYSTMGVGKWHLTPVKEVSPAGPFNNWPLAKGFDRFYGFLEGETDQFNPMLVYDNHEVGIPTEKDYQFSADVVRMASQFLTDQVSVAPDKPFFLYTAFSAVHTPLQAPKSYVDMYNGVYDQGYEKIREARFERQKKLGIIPADAKLSQDSKLKPWASLSEDEKKISARYQQLYAGYLTYADEQIGNLVDKLKALGQYDNTMIVLISDNGATGVGGESGAEVYKKSYFGVKTPTDYLLKHLNDLGGADFGAVYPRAWANVSNTPFPNYKETVFAGGTRTPLIIQWPNGIKPDDHVRSQYVHVTDITPTVLDVLKIQTPDTFKGIKQMPMDGVTIVPTFEDAQVPSMHGVQYTLHLNQRSIYKEGWKAIATHIKGTSFEEDTWNLYNLVEDFSETNDLALQYPEKLKELQALWQVEADRHGTPLREMNQIFKSSDEHVFKYYPGVDSIGMGIAPNLVGKSYKVTIPVNRTDKAQEGVIFSLGDSSQGFVMFIQNSRLVYEYHNFDNTYRIEAPIQVGKSLIEYKFDKTGFISGIGHLYIDGKLVGEANVEKSFIPLDALDIACDRRAKVSADYKRNGDFPFTGQYEYVLFEVE